VRKDDRGGWWTTPIWRQRGRLHELRWTHASRKTVHSCLQWTDTRLGWINQHADNPFMHCMVRQSIDSPGHTQRMDPSTYQTAHATITLRGRHTQLLQASTLLHLQKHSCNTSCVHHYWLRVIKFECGGLSPTEWPYMWIGNWTINDGWIGIEYGTTEHCMSSWEMNGARGGRLYKCEQRW
jgi:hypothetical protein